MRYVLSLALVFAFIASNVGAKSDRVRKGTDDAGIKALEGAAIMYGRLLPKGDHVFSNVGGDTLRLNGLPYWPLRGRISAAELLPPEMVREILERSKGRHEFRDATWKAVLRMHENGASYEECLDTFAAAYAKSPLVVAGSVQKWEEGISFRWANDGMEEGMILSFEGIRPYDRLKHHQELIAEFWRVVNSGGLVARGCTGMESYFITTPPTQLKKTAELLERISRGERLSQEDVLGTPLCNRTFRADVEAKRTVLPKTREE